MDTLLLQQHIRQFIHAHEQDDPFQLTLEAHRYPDMPIQAIAGQISARQKARHKLPAWYQTEGIVFPPLLSLEQCSSQAAARFKSSLVSGDHLIDLTGGVGVDTYYLSQSFKQTDYVEKEASLARLAQHNFEVLKAKNIAVHAAEAKDFLQTLPSAADCIYIDPARRDQHAGKVFKLEESNPDISMLLDTLMEKASTVLIKTSPMLDMEVAVRELQYVAQVYVVAVDNECKEVLYLLKKELLPEPEIMAVNLQKENVQKFSFTKTQEANTVATYAPLLQYLYEPHAALMKAGAFKTVAQAFGLYKLHINTHLYTSDQLVTDFPGRVFCCNAVVAYQKKQVHHYLPEGKANITVRNFPASVAQIRKKLNIQEGGDIYLFAATDYQQKRKVLICRKAASFDA